MKLFSASEAAQVLKIAPHILRYWTKKLPFVAPTKDASGRLQYSTRDIVLLQRVYYYFYQENLSLKTCQQKIIEELTDDKTFSKIQEIHELKADFVELLRKFK